MTPFMIIAIHYSHFNMPLFFIMLFNMQNLSHHHSKFSWYALFMHFT